MKRIFSFLIVFCFALSALAALSELDKAGFPDKNQLTNPGWESGKAGWTLTGAGTYTTVTAAANRRSGNAAGSFDASAASENITSNSVTITSGGGLSGANGEAACYIKAASGTATHTIQAYDGTNVLASQTINSSTSGFVRSSVLFPFPVSGTVALRIVSAADEPVIYVDDCYLGPPTRLMDINTMSGPFDYTPTIGLTGGSTTAAGKWWRRGDRLYAEVDATFSTVFTGGSATVSLPSSCTIDTNKIPGSVVSTLQNFGYARLYDVGTDVFDGSVVYSSTSAVLVRAYADDAGAGTGHINSAAISTTAPFTWANNDRMLARFEVPCVGWTPETAFRPETIAWRVDANISGANPDLGTSNQSSYTGLTNGSLTLTNNTGSGVLTAQIACAGTTPAEGTTCNTSAVNESVGISFNLPMAGDVLACADFTHAVATGAGGAARSYFQIVETPNNAQTISKEGGGRVGSGHATANIDAVYPHRTCGTFSFSSAGQKTLRLMYEQQITATVSVNLLLGDADSTFGQRDIHWTVEPLNQQVPAPLLVNSVTTSYTGLARMEAAEINCDAASAITSQLGSISSVGNRSTTSCALTLVTGAYSAAPYSCQVTVKAATVNATSCSCSSATACTIYGPNADYDAYVHLVGPR